MAINKNHLFKEIGDVRCSIVEQKIPESRMRFLKELLEYNGYTVVVETIQPPPPKPPAPDSPDTPPATATAPATAAPAPTPAPTLYTLGVTDVTFNPTNAIFGRLLHTPRGHVVTLAYWEQKESVSHDEVPYYEGPA